MVDKHISFDTSHTEQKERNVMRNYFFGRPRRYHSYSHRNVCRSTRYYNVTRNLLKHHSYKITVHYAASELQRNSINSQEDAALTSHNTSGTGLSHSWSRQWRNTFFLMSERMHKTQRHYWYLSSLSSNWYFHIFLLSQVHSLLLLFQYVQIQIVEVWKKTSTICLNDTCSDSSIGICFSTNLERYLSTAQPYTIPLPSFYLSKSVLLERETTIDFSSSKIFCLRFSQRK